MAPDHNDQGVIPAIGCGTTPEQQEAFRKLHFPDVSTTPDSAGADLARLSKVCARAIADANITNCRADEALPVVEAILAALNTSAPIAVPLRDDDDEVNRILAMSDAEVIAEIEAEGRDPVALAETMRGQMGATFKLCEEIKTLRDALAPFAAILAKGEPVGPIPRGLLDSKLTRQDLRNANAAYRASLPALAGDVPKTP